MMNSRRRLLLFTSIYPLPWQPNKATFNYQQYSRLAEHNDVQFIVPVPWIDWFINLPTIFGNHTYKSVCYFPFFYIPGVFRGLNSFFLVLSVLLSIIPAIRLIQARTVMASWAYPDGLACAWLKGLFRYRLFIQCLGSDVNVHCNSRFRAWLLAKSFVIADGVVTVSKALEHKVRELSATSNVQTIYNGVNFSQFTLANDKYAIPSIIFIGNLIKTKGIYELLDAAAMLLKSKEVYHFHFVGAGPERASLEKLALEKGIAQSVTFHGTIDHALVVNLLQKCTLLALPSYREGVPNVIMESIACGVPVVATRVGGIPEVVNANNGVLINDYHPETISSGIKECLSKEWDGEKIRASISSYSWEKNIYELNQFLHSTNEPRRDATSD